MPVELLPCPCPRPSMIEHINLPDLILGCPPLHLPLCRPFVCARSLAAAAPILID